LAALRNASSWMGAGLLAHAASVASAAAASKLRKVITQHNPVPLLPNSLA
jgi:hypothetical protein